MYLEIFLVDFAVFRVFFGISRKYLNFAGLWPHEISEALLTAGKKLICLDKESLEIQAKAVILFWTLMKVYSLFLNNKSCLHCIIYM